MERNSECVPALMERVLFVALYEARIIEKSVTENDTLMNITKVSLEILVMSCPKF